MASAENHSEIVSMLIQARANIDQKSNVSQQCVSYLCTAFDGFVLFRVLTLFLL